jgi:DNA-binding CsgD family transcriptional regulator
MTVFRPPPGLEVESVELGGETVLVFSWPAGEPEDIPALTAAERAMLEGILAGHSNAVIARGRRTSLRTVANQVASLFRKLGVSSRAQLVARLAARRMSEASG